MSDMVNSQKVSYAVFFSTVIVVLLVLIPLIFPALFSYHFGMFAENLNPFELGYLTSFLIISNVIIFGFGIIYYKKKIPSFLYDTFEKIRTFEISKRISLIALVAILAIYIGFTLPELAIDDVTQYNDSIDLEDALKIWPSTDSDQTVIKEFNTRYVRMMLLDASSDIFQNIKLLPFLASILVVFFTYLITVQFCKKRFAGIVSIVVLLQSHLFLKFDTIAVYENFWVLFFLISQFRVHQAWF